MKKSNEFRNLLHSGATKFIMEAHNALSARIVEEAGFPAVWASSLSIAASLGVRDNNEASWTQVLDVIEFMADATTIPILADGDTGHGNFNNVRRFVRKLEQRGVAAICIEDKVFPKANSFINGRDQKIEEIHEFIAKIKAAKDTQRDAEFCVVARLEGLVVGCSLAEVLDRAHAYHAAGADALMIHSTRREPDEVLEFARHWAGRCPMVVAPTAYKCASPIQFEQAGISVIIWANHCLRASIMAMQQVCSRVYQRRNVTDLENAIVPLTEVFRLQNMPELLAATNAYFSQSNISAILESHENCATNQTARTGVSPGILRSTSEGKVDATGSHSPRETADPVVQSLEAERAAARPVMDNAIANPRRTEEH